MRPSRLHRLARGASAAVLATFVALVSHVSAGGSAPGPLGVVAPLVLSIMVCTLLAGRRLSVLRTACSVLVAQALFHVLFSLGAVRAAAPPPSGSGGHVHDVVVPMAMEAHAHGGPGMWLGHAVAALVTVVALVQADRVAGALLSLGARTARVLVRALRLLLGGATAPRGRAAAVLAAAPLALPRIRLLDAAPRRGPPLRTA